ncbi:hypothetical protein [Streptosporangium sp. KLBMP 9127]|nr:hypothetical protein [Streptosporangium sp. KLBMP 9127]
MAAVDLSGWSAIPASLVVGNEAFQPVQLALFSVVAEDGRERIGHEHAEFGNLLLDLGNVGVRASDVAAAGTTVVDVRSEAGVVFPELHLAERFVRVRDTRHAHALDDLEVEVAQQVLCLSGGAQHAPAELGGAHLNPLFAGVCGRAADVFTGLEPSVGLDELLDAVEPLLEGEFVGKAGVIGAAVTKSHFDVDVSVLDRGGDQAAGLARDEPGQVAAEPADRDRAVVTVGRYLLGQAVVSAVVVPAWRCPP